jgi:putative transposase
MPSGLERRYGLRQLHFITFSCRRRKPFLASPAARDVFLAILDQVRKELHFVLAGYVVMPEHVHMLIGEPAAGSPSSVIMIVKQRSSKEIRDRGLVEVRDSFWETRFYDFNVWSNDKRGEKLNYMHMNPVKRGLVMEPEDWMWSSYRFYEYREKGVCTPDLIGD